jgi:hypothetical protein
VAYWRSNKTLHEISERQKKLTKKLTAIEKIKRSTARKLSARKPPASKPIKLPSTAKNLNSARKAEIRNKAKVRETEARNRYRAELASIRQERDNEIKTLRELQRVAKRFSSNKKNIPYSSRDQLENLIATETGIIFDDIPSMGALISEAQNGKQGIRVTIPYTYNDYTNLIFKAQETKIFSAYFITVNFVTDEIEHKSIEGLVRITHIYDPIELGLDQQGENEDDEETQVNMVLPLMLKYRTLESSDAKPPLVLGLTVYLKFSKQFENEHRTK